MTTTSIEPLVERLLAGEPLSPDDRDALASSHDLLVLGMAADTARRRRHGDQVTFARVALVPVDRAAAGDVHLEGSPREVRLVGEANDLDQMLDATRAANRAAAGLAVTGFSLADLVRTAGAPDRLAALLTALSGAGLTAVADAPLDRLEEPAIALTAAREAGLPVARLTVERAGLGALAVVDKAAALVERFAEILAFAPLPSRLAGTAPTTGYDDVRLVALARLLVPVPHIQVDWRQYGPKLAQVALTFGADDLDSVSPADEVIEGRRRSPLEEVRRNIIAASSRPLERGPLTGAPR